MLCPSCKAENDGGAVWCVSCGGSLTETAGMKAGSVIAGRYEILAPLGKGGMGAVFRAHDRALDETVAIKVLRSDMGVTREMDRRFRAEIKLARRISHKNVCRIHEYGEDGELRYLSMAVVDGVDLKRIIKEKGRLAPEEAFDVALQVADGLQAIHDEGIAHRDLKTPNIMRDERGVVRLMDFGIAKQWTGGATGELTATGMIVGTPEYMSPEQVRGEKVDGRTDIYALGIVLYEVFTGRVPFCADTPVATLWLRRPSRRPPPHRATAPCSSRSSPGPR
jgi:eukaryotic-like serine/threonine-protein kinase